jgi:excisionase family DNA binding protein
MVTLNTLDRLAELQQRLAALGLGDYRDAVDEALRVLGGPPFPFLRTGEAARALGVSVPTIKRWGRRGILPITRVHGRWLVPAESIEHLKQAAPVIAERDSADVLGAPLPRAQQRRMLALGRRANDGSLTSAERAEYEALISEAEQRSARAALAAVAASSPQKAATLRAEVARSLNEKG